MRACQEDERVLAEWGGKGKGWQGTDGERQRGRGSGRALAGWRAARKRMGGSRRSKLEILVGEE